jgi:4'-phosphopantetheinyl transferase
MTAQWLRAASGEVPAGDEWLSDHERLVLAELAVAKRRADWRLGRWTAKALLVATLGVPAHRLEVRAAADGAPEAYVDGFPAGVSLSLSHRDGVAVAAVVNLPATVGIDLETVETRSDAFVHEWLSTEEQAGLPPPGDARDLRVMCCWTGKEASAKVLREGLRLDVRRAVVVPGPPPPAGGWVPVRVTWAAEGVVHRGWWRRDGSGLTAIVTDPPTGPPLAIDEAATSTSYPRVT